jgi:hypothetical protein
MKFACGIIAILGLLTAAGCQSTGDQPRGGVGNNNPTISGQGSGFGSGNSTGNSNGIGNYNGTALSGNPFAESDKIPPNDTFIPWKSGTYQH